MLIKQFVRKNALNSQVFLGKLFQKKANARLFAEPRAVSVNQQHPQQNRTKSVELEIVYAQYINAMGHQ